MGLDPDKENLEEMAYLLLPFERTWVIFNLVSSNRLLFV
jgi:hypothetical protein